MNYTKGRAGATTNIRCLRFCTNVCRLFSSGRIQCVNDCLACRRTRPLLAKHVHSGAGKKKACGCGCK